MILYVTFCDVPSCRWQVFWTGWSLCVRLPSILASTQRSTGIRWLFASPRRDARRRYPTCPSTSSRELISQRTGVTHIAPLRTLHSSDCCAAYPNVLYFPRCPATARRPEGPYCHYEEAPQSPVVCSPDDTATTC